MLNMSKVKDKKRFFWGFLFACAFLLHFFVVQNKFLSLEEVFDDGIIMNYDYGLHYYDVVKGVEFLNQNHSFHGYDSAFFGGYEKGVNDDLSAKFWILFVWIFSFLGVMTAYKLFVYLTLLIMPCLFARAFKAWRARREVVLAAFLLAILYQNTFKMGNFLWVGMITFPLAAYLSILCIALLKRFFEDRQLFYWLAFTILAALSFYVHVLAVVSIGVPALLLYFQNFKKIVVKDHLLLCCAAALIFAANLPWLWPLLSGRSGNLGGSVTKFFQSPAWQDMWREIFYVWLPQSFHHLNLRIFLLIGAIVSLFFLCKKYRKSFYLHGGVIAVFAIITYLPLPQLAYIQPYRFQVVLDLWCLVTILLSVNLVPPTKKLQLKMSSFSALIAVFIVVSFLFAPLKNILANERILSTEINPALASTISYFDNIQTDDRVLFEVEHSADAVFFHLKTGLEMIGGPYRYAFWGNTEANFTEDAIFGVDINNVDDAKWLEMIAKYNLEYAVCYSEKSCSALEKTKVWQQVADYGERKVFVIVASLPDGH